jgi:hypothetical protein
MASQSSAGGSGTHIFRVDITRPQDWNNVGYRLNSGHAVR